MKNFLIPFIVLIFSFNVFSQDSLAYFISLSYGENGINTKFEAMTFKTVGGNFETTNKFPYKKNLESMSSFELHCGYKYKDTYFFSLAISNYETFLKEFAHSKYIIKGYTFEPVASFNYYQMSNLKLLAGLGLALNFYKISYQTYSSIINVTHISDSNYNMFLSIVPTLSFEYELFNFLFLFANGKYYLSGEKEMIIPKSDLYGYDWEMHISERIMYTKFNYIFINIGLKFYFN